MPSLVPSDIGETGVGGTGLDGVGFLTGFSIGFVGGETGA